MLTAGFEREEYATAAKVADWWELADYVEARRGGWFQVQYPATPAEFPLVCRLAGALGSCALVIEEADRYLKPWERVAEFEELVARGRHFGEGEGVSLIVMARRPAELPISFRADCDRLVMFHNSEPSDVDWLAKKIGKENALRVAALPRGEVGLCRGLEWRAGVEGCADVELRA